MNLSPQGLALLKRLEGLRLRAYRCSAGRLTVGYGHCGADVTEGLVITEERADELLAQDVAKFEADVLLLTRGVQLRQCELDALVLFAFNVGSDIDQDHVAEGLGDSTLLRKLLAGDRRGAADCFLAWDKVKDPKTGAYARNEGLAARRSRERALFLAPEPVRVTARPFFPRSQES